MPLRFSLVKPLPRSATAITQQPTGLTNPDAHATMIAPMDMRPLPPQVVELLEMVEAPLRLRAHLALVHDVSVRLTEMVSEWWPTLAYDREAVQMGAATHDIGKIVFPDEMMGAGRHHEAVGAGVLADVGIPERFARFTRTHGRWAQDESVTVEDLLVALANTLWKGTRDEDLEERFCQTLAQQCGAELWTVYLKFADMAEAVVRDAPERLAWQEAHPL